MNWLITGGAGYIGAHVVRALQEVDEDVIVVDDLSTGRASRLDPETPLLVAPVQDTHRLLRIMTHHHVDGVIHLAALKAVGDSVREPLEYYRQNVHGLNSVLTAMVQAGVGRILFSSSAAVYGRAASGRVTERAAADPISPYGETKQIGERLLRDAGAAYGLEWAALRYFNVGGAATPRLADQGTDNVIPRLLNAAEEGTVFDVFGVHHPTPDGTCIRDYVHVADVADAHLTVAARLGSGSATGIYNIGRGVGASVLEVVAAACRATGRRLRWRAVEPRAGDAAVVIADPAKIHAQLGWTATHGLDDIVASSAAPSLSASRA